MPGTRISTALILLAPVTGGWTMLAAQAAPPQSSMVHCVDGTTSKPGAGACQGHGGVRAAVQVNAAPAAPPQGAVQVNAAPASAPQGAVQVNAPPPKSSTGAVAVTTPPVGTKRSTPANVVHCMDGTTEPKSPPGIMRLSPYCEHHGGVNDRPTQVGVPAAHPTGAVAVTTPPVGTKSSKPANVVHCMDGTTEPKSPPGIMRLSPYCEHHGGVNDRATTVGVPASDGSVKVNAPPSTAPSTPPSGGAGQAQAGMGSSGGAGGASTKANMGAGASAGGAAGSAGMGPNGGAAGQSTKANMGAGGGAGGQATSAGMGPSGGGAGQSTKANMGSNGEAGQSGAMSNGAPPGTVRCKDGTWQPKVVPPAVQCGGHGGVKPSDSQGGAVNH